MDMMESFMLASVNRRNGALLGAKSILAYGLAGIAAYELFHAGRIVLDGKSIALKSSSRTGNAFLDETIDFLGKKNSAGKLTLLIGRLSYRVNRFPKRVLERLEDNGVLKIEQNRFLGLIPYNRYVISRENTYTKLTEELKEIIRRDEKRPDRRKAMLITTLSACNVLHRLFDKEERKQFRTALKRIGKAEYFETLDEFGTGVHKAVKTLVTAARNAAT